MQEKKLGKNFKLKKITIIGVIPSFAFQRAKYCALELHRKLPQKFPCPKIIGLLELDWSEKLQEWRATMGKEYWCLRRPVAVFFNDQFIGSDIELIKLVTIGNVVMESIPRKTMSYIKNNFRKDYIAYLRKSERIYCCFDICVEDVYLGTMTFQLYNDIVPKTCDNFKTLCLGARGPLLSYKGSRIHRIVKGGWLQGGDVQYKTGGGGFSIFCDPLEDENFGVSHTKRGVLSMANGGRNQNGSQFFITLKPSQWMDTNFVAFGQLIEGSRVLKELENLETLYECPLKKVEIKNCGKLDLEDVEDVDVMHKEEPMLEKKRKRFESVSEQLVRLIMEALTEALKRKERASDILDGGDIPSKMNLQLYFQGFYSLPRDILERTAKYFRTLRRELFRVVKPSATEVVEVIMYDLLMAVLTRMTTLDDVRETIGHNLYNKMISGIGMKMELCKKSYVRRLVDQITTTAESMVDLVLKKLRTMKGLSENLKNFQERMQNWVQSFVLQETFKNDNYFIAERSVVFEKPKEEEKVHKKREPKPCCELKKKKKNEEMKAKLLGKFSPEDLCCLSPSKLKIDSELNLFDYFSTCRYDLKRMPQIDKKNRMPLLDLIEISRFKLRFIRKQENRMKSEEILCTEKKIRKWLEEVVYIPETDWLKDAVFPKDCMVFDHVEEIMYGAMTAGLLEMYYFMEEYLRRCGGKKQKVVTRTIYPEEFEPEKPKSNLESDASSDVEYKEGLFEEDEEEEEEEHKEEKEEDKLPPCTCGHPCCVCKFDPAFKTPVPPPPSLDEEREGEDEVVEEIPPPIPVDFEQARPCASDEIVIDMNALLAKKVSVNPEEINIKSFKWLKKYILEEGCDLKSQFAAQVHKWLEGERFNYKGFISKQSLVTRASLLSLSLSMAELMKEENNLKKDIKNLIYDLWDLYFEEMFKEAYLQFHTEEEEEKAEKVGEGEGERESKDEKESKIETLGEDEEGGEMVGEGGELRIFCQQKFPKKIVDAELEAFCAKFEEQAAQLRQEAFESKQETQPKDDKPINTDTKQPEIKQEQQHESPKEAKPVKTEAEPPEIKKEQKTIPDEGGEPVQSKFQESIEDIKLQKHTTDGGDGNGGGDTAEIKQEEPLKKKKSPIVIEELIDETSSEESRKIPPYVLPFWVKFLTEITKQALGALANVSRLPRRLYFHTESEMAFDDNLKAWFEFNSFNPQPTKGREIMDFIAVHHKSLTDLEDTARSYLKKKKYTELLNRCTRFSSADDMAEEILAGVIDTAMEGTEDGTLELFVSNLVSSAITASSMKSQSSSTDDEGEGNNIETDRRESYDLERDENDD